MRRFMLLASVVAICSANFIEQLASPSEYLQGYSQLQEIQTPHCPFTRWSILVPFEVVNKHGLMTAGQERKGQNFVSDTHHFRRFTVQILILLITSSIIWPCIRHCYTLNHTNKCACLPPQWMSRFYHTVTSFKIGSKFPCLKQKSKQSSI